jgi:hypothetical protein
MVLGDASEVQLAGYLRAPAESRGHAVMDARRSASPPLADWMAERILAPEELQRHRRQTKADDGRD